jgi:carbon monoxide dehydrogenase subunit G
MAITITETFELRAPPARVWEFLLDPHEVVRCMPGAALDEVVDERSFLGTIRIKVGPVVTSYRGRVRFVDVDAPAFRIEMVADGRETAGAGSARATMTSALTPIDAGTRVVAEARAEITGRVMQFGQSMIEGVSHQLFLEFVKRARERLEVSAGEEEETPDGRAIPARVTDEKPEAVSIIPVVLGVVWNATTRFVRRLLGRGRARPAE